MSCGADEQEVDRRVLAGECRARSPSLEPKAGGGEQVERAEGAMRPFEGTATRRRPSVPALTLRPAPGVGKAAALRSSAVSVEPHP